nr:hypothetical protein [Pseudanabaena sp. SR411]
MTRNQITNGIATNSITDRRLATLGRPSDRPKPCLVVIPSKGIRSKARKTGLLNVISLNALRLLLFAY